MADLALGDIDQLYNHTLCRYKGELVHVRMVHGDGFLSVFSLEHQREKRVKFVFEDFGAPQGRIGFVNHGNWCFYVMRKPLRRFNVGLTKGSMKFLYPTVENPKRHNLHRSAEEMVKLELRAVLHAADGKYPTFQEATESALENTGVYAFDRQFAIDYQRQIWWKDKKIGHLPSRCRNKDRIRIDEPFQHLELLLTQDYEKTVRTFGV